MPLPRCTRRRLPAPYFALSAFLFLIYTAIVWFLHGEAADTLLTVALVFSVSCLAVALYEVVTSHRIGRVKKALWVAGLLLLNWPAMLYYVFVARKNECRISHCNKHRSLPAFG